MSVPVLCPNCGYLFKSNAFAFMGNAKVTLSGNKETCPKCRSMANILDGEYEFYNGILERVKGANLTIESAKKLNKITQEVLNSDLNSTQLRDRLSLIDKATGLNLTNLHDADMTNKSIIIALTVLAIYFTAMIAELGVKTTDALIDNFSQNTPQIEK